MTRLSWPDLCRSSWKTCWQCHPYWAGYKSLISTKVKSLSPKHHKHCCWKILPTASQNATKSSWFWQEEQLSANLTLKMNYLYAWDYHAEGWNKFQSIKWNFNSYFIMPFITLYILASIFFPLRNNLNLSKFWCWTDCQLII